MVVLGEAVFSQTIASHGLGDEIQTENGAGTLVESTEDGEVEGP